MTTQEQAINEEYRRQIRACARNLAVARNEAVVTYLPAGATPKMVDVFTDGNLDKRIDKLNDQLEFLRAEFPDLDACLKEYVRTVPLAAYDTGSTDSSRFLDWVREREELTPQQADLATCHQSRISVEEKARANRMEHVRFQEQWSLSDRLLPEFETDPNLRLFLNPISVRGTFRTDILLDDGADVPAMVLFFAVENEIRTAVFEAEGIWLIQTLRLLTPCHLSEVLRAAADWDREEVIAVCRDLVEMGMLALG